MNIVKTIEKLRKQGYAIIWFEPSELKSVDPRAVEESLTDFGYGVIDELFERKSS